MADSFKRETWCPTCSQVVKATPIPPWRVGVAHAAVTVVTVGFFPIAVAMINGSQNNPLIPWYCPHCRDDIELGVSEPDPNKKRW